MLTCLQIGAKTPYWCRAPEAAHTWAGGHSECPSSHDPPHHLGRREQGQWCSCRPPAEQAVQWTQAYIRQASGAFYKIEQLPVSHIQQLTSNTVGQFTQTKTVSTVNDWNRCTHVYTHVPSSHVKLHTIDLCQSSRLQNTIIGMCLHVCVGGRWFMPLAVWSLESSTPTSTWEQDCLLGNLCMLGRGECLLASIAHVSTVEQSCIPATYISWSLTLVRLSWGEWWHWCHLWQVSPFLGQGSRASQSKHWSHLYKRG